MSFWRVLLIFLFALPSAWAKPKYGNFERQVKVNGVGEVKLEYVFSGEPVSRPRSMSIYVKCARGKPWAPVGQYQMCELKNYDLDLKAKKLTLSYTDGRVDPTTGVSVCDRADDAELDLSDLCED